MSSSPGSAMHTVVVAVCTFRRNSQLAALIERIDGLAGTEVADGTIAMVVVDDSPEGGAAEVVARLRADVAMPLEYRHTASADIAIARNCAIETAMALGEFVACLDDDCVPDPGWLRELLRVARARHADIVVGHRVFFAAPEAPSWLSSEPFLEENALYADESVPSSGNTANVLLRSGWLAASGVRFRAEFGKVGGEDMVFFADAGAVGAEIRFAAGSVSHEPCDGRRATFRYQLWRQAWLGNNEAVINRSTHAVAPLRLLLRGAKRTARGVLHPVIRLAHRSSPQFRWALAFAGRGVGLILGVFGVRVQHRS
ncbi:MAG: glycosyltransferase family 2 protein [Actinomycetota bacterium]|nr:glycosyltransferase family 2 protein [Actinomycetota bacterium]